MNAQPTLFEAKVQVPGKLSPAERWPLWRDANGAALKQIEDLALAALRVGKRRFSVKWAFEEVRASVSVVPDGGDWKLDNRFTSFVADWLIEQHAELEHIIERRRRTVH